MPVLQVGKPYHPKRKKWPEAATYNCRSGQSELVLFWPNPREKEVRAVRQGDCHFGVFAPPGSSAIFFLYKFAGAADWSDAPFSIHRLPEDEREAPAEPKGPDDRALLSVVLVDADAGLVRALRLVSLTPAVTAALHAAVRAQLQAPYPGDTQHGRDVTNAQNLWTCAEMAAQGVTGKGGA